EADVGRVHEGQEVTFHVDAFPQETFTGRVQQVRLQPVTVQNVVTYNTLIAAPNPGGKLLPGLTATVSVIIDRREDVLRVPAAATRFPREGSLSGEARPRGSPGAGPRRSRGPGGAG